MIKIIVTLVIFASLVVELVSVQTVASVGIFMCVWMIYYAQTKETEQEWILAMLLLIVVFVAADIRDIKKLIRHMPIQQKSIVTK